MFILFQPWFKQQKFSRKIRLAKLVVHLAEKYITQKYQQPGWAVSLRESESFFWNYSMLKSRCLNKKFWIDKFIGGSSNERYIRNLVPMIFEDLNPYLTDTELSQEYTHIALTGNQIPASNML